MYIVLKYSWPNNINYSFQEKMHQQGKSLTLQTYQVQEGNILYVIHLICDNFKNRNLRLICSVHIYLYKHTVFVFFFRKFRGILFNLTFDVVNQYRMYYTCLKPLWFVSCLLVTLRWFQFFFVYISAVGPPIWLVWKISQL